MDTIIDSELQQPAENKEYVYGGFWPRVGALFLDGLVMSPVAVGLTYFNATQWKSIPLLILVSLFGISYKPLMEHLYGATLGKMALNLKVVNLQHERATLAEILSRNIFQIVPGLLSMVMLVGVYSDPEFVNVTGYFEYSAMIARTKRLSIVNWSISLIYIPDVIVLWSNKERQALHDKIGKTYVIVKRS